MRTEFQHLIVKQDGGVLTITMNRPEVLNAFNDAMLSELTEAVEAAARDEAVRCVVLTGAGRAFGSGQDLHSLVEGRSSGTVGVVSDHLQKYHRVVYAIREMPKPVIAAVRGVAAGISCNIALACDLRIASDDARFIEAFARIGLVPDGGGGYFLPRLVGVGKALEMSMLADEVRGAEAERIGLVNKCVPLEEFEDATQALAQRLAKGPTRAYALIKRLIYTSAESDLRTSMRLEGELQDMAFETGALPTLPESERKTQREIGIGAQILSDLNLRRIRLLTNHPRRVAALEGFDIEIVEQVPVRLERVKAGSR